MHHLKPSLEHKLHAYADNQLSDSDKMTMMQQLKNNPELRQKLADIYLIKNLVKTAYSQTEPRMRTSAANDPATPAWQRMAASILLMTALATGWVSNDVWQGKFEEQHTVVAIGQAKTAGNYLLQMSTGDTAMWQQSLTEMQRLLTLSPQVHVELVVNDEGLALLGSHSPLAQQIKQMSNQADRLRFVACKQSVERSRVRGKSITLLPNVDTSHTALEEVMLRLEQGWHVIRV